MSKMTNKEKAKKLRKIARYLSVWKESGPEGPEHSKKARKSAEEAMKLLGSSADLLHYCKETYGFKYRQSESSLKSLNGILDYMRINDEAPEFITERTGYYDYQDFAQDAFINELNHWAKKLVATTKEHKDKTKAISSINIQNSNVILGDVQSKNLQIGDNSCIDKQPVPENSADTKQNRKTTIVAIIISFIVNLVFELLVYFVPFSWVKNHPNSYGLQGSIIFLIPCLIVGLFKPQYRKWCWGVGAIAFIVLLLSLMGGPAESNVN